MQMCSGKKTDGSPCPNPVCREDARGIGEAMCADHFVAVLAARHAALLEIVDERSWTRDEKERIDQARGLVELPPEYPREVMDVAVEWARGYGPWDSGNPDHIGGGDPEDDLYNALVRWKRRSPRAAPAPTNHEPLVTDIPSCPQCRRGFGCRCGDRGS